MTNAVLFDLDARQDIERALGVGMRAVSRRIGIPAGDAAGQGSERRGLPTSVPVIRSLRELAALV